MTDVSQAPADDSTESANMKHLREKADRSDAQAEEIRLLKTDKAFTQAGISTAAGTPGALLYSTFQPGEGGEITMEAVLEYAQSFGVNPAQAAEATAPATGEPQVGKTQGDAERGFFDGSRGLGSGSDMTVSDPDPNDEGFKAFTTTKQSGGSDQTAIQAGLGALIQGAAAGDKRVLYDQAEFRRKHA